MHPTRLKDHDFQISYGPADDRLHDFYIPALACSVRYDRTAGFFSSSALAVAAAGVARLIANGGTMRLLVGAQLSEADVRAIERGQALDEVVAERLVAALSKPEEEVMRRRLEVLAWMVAAGRLQIRVVLPKGPGGHPLPASLAQDYFHPKEGLFTDRYGDQIAFSGSVNESATSWQCNYEQFMVFRSWDASRPFLSQVALRFQRLWDGQEPDWIALEVPEAARQQLLRYRPATAPTRDPLEREPARKPIAETKTVLVTEGSQRERMLFQFLRDAPYLLDSRWLGAATSAVTPWPHQARTADTILSRFPERFLLCDEVGLGKTIEAGLVLRQLLLSGYVRRCLILAPKSVCRQWQEELYEKFALNIPFFDGHTFHDVFVEEHVPDDPNPWNAVDVFIASSQLAKRRERQPELLAARPWDLLLVDEAHHARRKDFLANRYRPNRLLDLLMGQDGQPGLKDHTQYTDTMDFLREQLRQVYSGQVACYSGRGGEVWNGIGWVRTTKEEIKNAFRAGEEVKILVCTEAASEGLNLQTCGVLINYDMPWNPMRVEQRIGRIDRIGQTHDRVWIRHYFYEDTVEARVYRALEDRIGWFEDVVGELQPILARMKQSIQTVAMTPGAERERVLAQELATLRKEIDSRQAEGFDLDEYLSADEPLQHFASPVLLTDLERVLTQAPSLAGRFRPPSRVRRCLLAGNRSRRRGRNVQHNPVRRASQHVAVAHIRQ